MIAMKVNDERAKAAALLRALLLACTPRDVTVTAVSHSVIGESRSRVNSIGVTYTVTNT